MGEHEPEVVLEEKSRSPLRTGLTILLAALLVMSGYFAVILIGGEALRSAPFGRFILQVRGQLENLFGFEAPDISLPPLGDVIAPTLATPFVAPLLSPSPVPSPVQVPPPPDEPSLVTFTIEYVNDTGVMLTSVRLVNPLPSGTTYRSSRPSGSLEGDRVVWSLGTLGIGERGRVVLQVATKRKGLIRNQATMISEEAPPSQVESSVNVP